MRKHAREELGFFHLGEARGKSAGSLFEGQAYSARLFARDPRPICRCVQRTWSPAGAERHECSSGPLTYDRSNEPFWTGGKTTQAKRLGGRRPVSREGRCPAGAWRRRVMCALSPPAKDQAAKQIASVTRLDSSRVQRMCSAGGGQGLVTIWILCSKKKSGSRMI
jgi:hypothetical protein